MTWPRISFQSGEGSEKGRRNEVDSTGHNEVTAAAARLSPQTTTNNKANHLVSVCISRADVNFINYTFILIFFFFPFDAQRTPSGGSKHNGRSGFFIWFFHLFIFQPRKKKEENQSRSLRLSFLIFKRASTVGHNNKKPHLIINSKKKKRRK